MCHQLLDGERNSEVNSGSENGHGCVTNCWMVSETVK